MTAPAQVLHAASRFPWQGILSATVFCALPALWYGFPYGHDSVQDAAWFRCFNAQFWAGELYPRWLTGMNAGLGSPSFFVYGPVPFFITALLAPLLRWLPPASLAPAALTASALAGLLISGVAAYLFLRKISTPRAALVGALAYLIAPYHVVIDLYVRFALAELWAFAWMPCLLYFTQLLIERNAYATIGIAVTGALLIATHPLTALIFLPLLFLYVCFSRERGRLWLLAKLFAAMLLGAGLAGAYLLPALDHRRYISIQQLIANPHYDWSRNFLYLDRRLFSPPSGGPNQVVCWYLSWLLLLMAATVVVCLVTTLAAPGNNVRRRAAFWFMIAGGCMLMTLPASAPVWRLLPPLHALQFPWRFLAILTLAASVLCCLAVESLSGRLAGVRRLACAALCLLLAVWLLSILRCWLRYPALSPDQKELLEASVDPLTPTWARWIPPDVRSAAGFSKLSALTPRVSIEDGTGSAAVEWRTPRDARLWVALPRSSALILRQLYYPGWRARAGAGDLPVGASAAGLIRVQAPAGKHSLRVWLDGGRSEPIGWFASALALVILLLLARAARLRRRNHGKLRE